MTIHRLARQGAILLVVFTWTTLSQTIVGAKNSGAPLQVSQAGQIDSNTTADIVTRPVASMVGQGLGLLRSNHNDQAATLLKRTVELYPKSAEAHHTLGFALAKLGDSEHAIRELEIAKMLDPSSDSTWLTLAGLHQSLGHMDEAIVLYNDFLANKDFDKRADLQDTRKRIKALVDGLSREHSSMATAQEEAMALRQPTTHSIARGIMPVPAQPDTRTDDYLAEATRSGSLTWSAVRMPIKIYIGSGETVPGYKKQWREILVRSFDDWSRASNGLVRFKQVINRNDANIECFFVYDESRNTGGMDNDAEAGESKMFMDKDGLSSGTIKVLTRSLSNMLPLTDNRIRVICLHEIGHALGLAGHTTNPDDIMFYSTSFKDEWRELSGRDARTIQRLYSSN